MRFRTDNSRTSRQGMPFHKCLSQISRHHTRIRRHEAATIASATNFGITQILLRLRPVSNARSYETQLCMNGGSTGKSDWSKSFSIMAT
jgi:hypothetical protein